MTHYIKKIEQIKFGLMSPEDILKMSVVKVEYPDTYGDDGFPIEKGLMDPRLGIVDPSLVCRTCGFKGGDCQGHFGHIELARPVIHVGFGDVIHKILRSTCNKCGRILLDDNQINVYEERIRDAMDNKESISSILKEVYRHCKKERSFLFNNEFSQIDTSCPHCGAPQEPILLDKPVTIRQGDYKLTPAEVRERLERITDDDAFILGVNSEVARPEWLVLTVLPVPPVTVRPSITLDTGERSEDDLTHKLVDILRINQRLLENMEAGAPQLIVEDLWELLQYHVTTYFDNEASGVPPARHRSGRPLKTLTQRLKGKEGRFRSNLSGKRVNFSARTVISPDPNISINEVGVPEMIAKEVTVPEIVTDWNMDEVKTYIENGPDVHPGANYVISGYTKRRVTEETKEFILEQLEPGYIIERHLKDGDIVLFNRQPSLHRQSMMAHEVRVLPYKTFRLNLCACPPYNADFDGDEMNLHVLQSLESRAEAKSLLRVQEHILSPRFGGPIIGAIHDHISGAYLLTRDGVEFTEEEALQIIRKSHLKIPPLIHNQWVLKYDLDTNDDSFIYKDKGDKWTGKELFSLLLPNDLNLSYSAEISKCHVVYPAEDATVVIKNGILEQGVIDESAYGSFSGKILDKIVKEYGSGRAREFLDRATDMAIYAVTKFGMTTSLNDEEIPEEAQARINEHLDKKMEEVDMLVQSYEEGYLRPLQGRSLEETLEMKIMQVLGEARDMSGAIAENYLTMGKQYLEDSLDHVMAVENHSVIMARTGARASMLNLTQITACVGQQAVRGGRIKRGYIGRTLPHFKKGELGAKAKGFVHSSYKSGLDPIEFFFHAVGGREGLVDTAIRTAQSGYMQRRLVNALQDLNVDFNGVVRNNDGMVIQTMFGDDGVDPVKSDFGKPADLNKLIDEMRINSNLSSEEIAFRKSKSELRDILSDFKVLYQKVNDEIEFFDNNSLKHDLYDVLMSIHEKMEYIESYIEDETDLDVISNNIQKYKGEYRLLKDNFKDEVDEAIKLNEEFFKQEVLNQTEGLNEEISKIKEEISIQKNKFDFLINQVVKSRNNALTLDKNLTDDLENKKQTIINSLNELLRDINSSSESIDDFSVDLSKIIILFDNLRNYSRIDDEFKDHQSKLKFFINQLQRKIENNEKVLDDFEIKLASENSKYQDIIEIVNNREKIINQLNEFKQPILEIEEDISNQVIILSSLESDVNNLYGELRNLNTNLSDTLEIQKNNIIYMLNKILNDLESHEDFEEEFNIQLDSINNRFNNLMEFTTTDNNYEAELSNLNKQINDIKINILDNEAKLDHFETELNIQKSNYNQLVESLNKSEEPKDDSHENDDEIYSQLIKYNELLKAGIITQEDFDELKKQLIFGNNSVNGKEQPDIENNEFLKKFKKYVEEDPFYNLMRNSFEFSDDEERAMLNEIESDIVQGKIKEGNIENIIRERFKLHSQKDYVEDLKRKLDYIIDDSEFYRDLSKEYVDLSNEEKQECINELIESFNLDFKENDIETTLKVLFEDKRKQKNDLFLLNKYRNNIEICIEKYNLDKNEVLNIFDEAQRDIIESKLSGKPFKEYIRIKFRDKVDENKVKAGNQLTLIYNKRSRIKERTHLNDKNLSIVFNDIELLISQNKVRYTEINEEFVITRCIYFIHNNGF